MKTKFRYRLPLLAWGKTFHNWSIRDISALIADLDEEIDFMTTAFTREMTRTARMRKTRACVLWCRENLPANAWRVSWLPTHGTRWYRYGSLNKQMCIRFARESDLLMFRLSCHGDP